LLSTVRSRRWRNNFYGTLEVTSTHRIAVGHTIRIVDVRHVAVYYLSTMWGFTWRLLSSQKFPFSGGGFMLVSIYTSRLSFRTNAVKLPHVFTCTSPLFNFNLFSPKWECISFLFDRTIPREFIFPVSKSSESLAECESLPKYMRVSYV
jgi:hypothetical protein